jgi:hypothetical protein
MWQAVMQLPRGVKKAFRHLSTKATPLQQMRLTPNDEGAGSPLEESGHLFWLEAESALGVPSANSAKSKDKSVLQEGLCHGPRDTAPPGVVQFGEGP